MTEPPERDVCDLWGREVARPDDILIALEELAALSPLERHELLGPLRPGDYITAGRVYFFDFSLVDDPPNLQATIQEHELIDTFEQLLCTH